MYTTPWYFALKLQILITIAAFLIGKKVLRINWATLLLAALLCFSVPVAQPPGFMTWLLPIDLVLPLLLFFALTGPPLKNKNLAILALITLFLWPLVPTGMYVLSGAMGFYWVTALWRNLLKVCLFFIGLRWGGRRYQFTEFFDSVILIWLGMAIVGTMQLYGILYVDFHNPHADYLKAGSLFEGNIAAQRGFLGIDRGGVGLFGATLSAYSLTVLSLSSSIEKKRLLLYMSTIILSYFVVFLSGSRTGMLACGAGVLFLGYSLIRLQCFVGIIRVMIFAYFLCIIAGIALKPTIVAGFERFSQIAELGQLQSWQFRVQMWEKTLIFIMSDFRSVILGLGEGSHAWAGSVMGVGATHNEYLQNLLDKGIIGFFLYIAMLVKIFVNLKVRLTNFVILESLGIRAAMITGFVCAFTVAFLTSTALKKMNYSCIFFFSTGILISQIRCLRAKLVKSF